MANIDVVYYVVLLLIVVLDDQEYFYFVFTRVESSSKLQTLCSLSGYQHYHNGPTTQYFFLPTPLKRNITNVICQRRTPLLNVDDINMSSSEEDIMSSSEEDIMSSSEEEDTVGEL